MPSRSSNSGWRSADTVYDRAGVGALVNLVHTGSWNPSSARDPVDAPAPEHRRPAATTGRPVQATPCARAVWRARRPWQAGVKPTHVRHATRLTGSWSSPPGDSVERPGIGRTRTPSKARPRRVNAITTQRARHWPELRASRHEPRSLPSCTRRSGCGTSRGRATGCRDTIAGRDTRRCHHSRGSIPADRPVSPADAERRLEDEAERASPDSPDRARVG